MPIKSTKISPVAIAGIETAPTSTAHTAPETAYSAAELAAAARSRFNVPPEVVQVALKVAGKDKATLTEAQGIIKAFMERKVR